jgi:acetyltransferase-like isoleucine patch superfamily enzyme
MTKNLMQEFYSSLRERGVWLTALRACDYLRWRFWVRGVKSFLVSVALRAKGVRVGRGVAFVKDNRFVTDYSRGAIEIGDRAVFGRHTILEGRGIKIGADVTLNNYCHVMSERRVEIGSDTLIAPHCFITDYDHAFGGSGGVLMRKRGTIAKPVLIGKNVWVGAHAVILKGVRIGDGAVIAAGSVVTRGVPANCVAAGVPARVVRRIRRGIRRSIRVSGVSRKRGA